MSYLLNNQQRFNDVVFEHRNKSYGAYAIRSAYGNTLFKSLLLMSLCSGTFISVAFYLSRSNFDNATDITEQVIPDVIYTVPVDMKPEEPAPASESKSRPDPGKPNTSAVSSTIIDTSAVETQSQSLNEDLAINTPSGSATNNGSDLPGGTGSTGTATTTGDEKATSPLGVYEVDAGPEFEGGLKALLQFVSSHLRYPAFAADEGKEGTVYVRFVVDEKGRVGDLKLQNNLGYGLDDEARRVVSMIPDFKSPAKVKGRAVKVYYQLPIKFKLR
jgi:protein TonB